MRKNRILIIAFLSAVLFFTACGNTTSDTVENSDNNDVKVSSNDTSSDTSSEDTSLEDTSSEDDSSVENDEEADMWGEDGVEQVKYTLVRHTISEYSDDLKGNLAQSDFDEIYLSDEMANEKLAETLSEFNSKKVKKSRKLYKKNIKWASKQYKDGDYYGEYKDCSDYHIRRSDTSVLSFIESGFSYSGGVHGYYYHNGFNYDATEGKRIYLDDVIKDIRDLPEIVENKMDDKYSDIMYVKSPGEFIKEKIKSGKVDKINFIINPNGIEIIFNPYSIASYADGLLSVGILFDEEPDLFNEKYIERPDEYGVSIDSNMEYADDFDDDGNPDSLFVAADMSEDDNIEKVIINLNGNIIKKNVYCYSFSANVIHAYEGFSCLVLDCLSDNDYHSTYVYKIKGNKVSQMQKNMNCKTHIDISDYEGDLNEKLKDEYIHAFTPMTNPDEIVLDSKLDILSTATGYRTYSLNGAGRLEPEEDWYMIRYYDEESGIVLTANKDLKGTVTSDDLDKDGESVTLKKGTKVKLYATDAESKVVVYEESNEENKYMLDIECEVNAYASKVAGEKTEDAFDGVMFAG